MVKDDTILRCDEVYRLPGDLDKLFSRLAGVRGVDAEDREALLEEVDELVAAHQKPRLAEVS